MAYNNCCQNSYSRSTDCPSCTAEYNVDSHGDIGAFYNSITNADLPKYTMMFYRPSQHEMLSDLKYSKLLLDYDGDAKNMVDAVHGPPIEAYLPHTVVLPEGGGTNSSVVMVRDAEVMPKRTIVDEILKAQAELFSKKIPEPGEFLMRQVDFEEEIHIKRRVRTLQIVKRTKE